MNLKYFKVSFYIIFIKINHIMNIILHLEDNLTEEGQMCLPIFNCAWAHVPTCPDFLEVWRTPSPCPRYAPKKWSIYFFENKIETHGTQVLRNKFGFDQIAQKFDIRCLFVRKSLTVR